MSTKINQTTELELMKKDISNLTEFIKKIDSTVEKIGDLNSSMHRMITLHEERILVQKQDDEAIRALIENRREEQEKIFFKLTLFWLDFLLLQKKKFL